MHDTYGSMTEDGEGGRHTYHRGGIRNTRLAVLIGVWTLALLVTVVLVGTAGTEQRTVLDDKVDDPLAGMDDTPHEWTDEHGAGYDPEQQNVLADDDAFEVPFVGYAKKDLKWRAPAEPETNVLDYLPQGDFSEPKSMELRALLGPYPADENVWGEGVTLDY